MGHLCVQFLTVTVYKRGGVGGENVVLKFSKQGIE